MSSLSSADRCRSLRRLLHSIPKFESQFSTLGSEMIFTLFNDFPGRRFPKNVVRLKATLTRANPAKIFSWRVWVACLQASPGDESVSSRYIRKNNSGNSETRKREHYSNVL